MSETSELKFRVALYEISESLTETSATHKQHYSDRNERERNELRNVFFTLSSVALAAAPAQDWGGETGEKGESKGKGGHSPSPTPRSLKLSGNSAIRIRLGDPKIHPRLTSSLSFGMYFDSECKTQARQSKPGLPGQGAWVQG